MKKRAIFWGYIDIYEKIHIKRYTNDRAIRQAQDNGLTQGIFDPFYAENIEMATYMILEKYREVTYFKKEIVENGLTNA